MPAVMQNPEVVRHIVNLQKQIAELQRKPDKTKADEDKIQELQRKIVRSRMRNKTC